MNYDEAKKYSFQVPWKVSECFNGPDCWCRIVVPVDPIIVDNDEEYEVVRDGCIDQPIAEYIVKLHNNHLEKVKQGFRDAINSIVPINEKEMIETFEKLWQAKNSRVGKIVRKEID